MRLIDYFERGHRYYPDRACLVDGTGELSFREAAKHSHRTANALIAGGLNVSPIEIERVIWSHPAVQDCAVIDVPDEKWGEAVKAVGELKQGERVSGDDLIALCKQELSTYKAPKTVEFWDELPRSGVGKVLKRKVRERFWAGHERRI